jgi:calpain-7
VVCGGTDILLQELVLVFSSSSMPAKPGYNPAYMAEEGADLSAMSLVELYKAAFDAVKVAKSKEIAGERSLASYWYTEAVRYFLQASKIETDVKARHLLKQRCGILLTNAETVKATAHSSARARKRHEATLAQQTAALPVPTRTELKTRSATTTTTTTTTATMPTGDLTASEKLVLRTTSIINGKLYLPFISEDLGQDFNALKPGQASYQETLLPLALKQQACFGGWARPLRICEAGAQYKKRGVRPRMIVNVSPYSIRQTLIGDCSFVSSLAICAYYETTFQKKLITKIIYPKQQGVPVYNPCGKYMIKLHLNGLERKVMIDDRLPVDKRGQLICSFSTNPGEFWVSLVEKAFLRAMGGYQFPGSNSGIDLYILTGWIPERVGLADEQGNVAGEDRLWRRLKDGLKFGDCLCTASTGGQMTEQEEQRIGLVGAHAYAVLQVRETTAGERLVQLKNPWTHTRWKGKFSPDDTINWTSSLRRELKYDPTQAKNQEDDGVFWMDLSSLLKFYNTMYLNWNPKLFAAHASHHFAWPLSQGPQSDSKSFKFNPQYALKVKIQSGKSASLWILLSRHVTVKEDEDEEFITVHLYKRGTTQGMVKRLYSAETPFIQGKYINNRHYLLRHDIPTAGDHHFLLVPSQFKKTRNLYFTLNVYSTQPCALAPIPLNLRHHRRILGAWRPTAVPSSPGRLQHCPQFYLKIDSSTIQQTRILLQLEAPKEYFVNLYVLRGNTRVTVPVVTDSMIVMKCAHFRDGAVVLDIAEFACGDYIIVPVTFKNRDTGSFFLSVETNKANFSLKQLI